MARKINYNKMFEEPVQVEHFDDIVEEVTEMLDFAPEPEPRPVTAVGVVDCKNKLNLRVEPDANANIIKILDKGAEVLIYTEESTADFYKVCTESGLEGYCMKKFVVLQ